MVNSTKLDMYENKILLLQAKLKATQDELEAVKTSWQAKAIEDMAKQSAIRNFHHEIYPPTPT